MTMKLAPRPHAAMEAAKNEVSQLARTGGFLTPKLRAERTGRLAVSTWHRVLVLGHKSLTDCPEPIREATETGWRFFIHRENRIVAAIEVRRTASGHFRPGPLTEGPLVDGTVRAFAEAEMLLGDQTVSREPVLIQDRKSVV